MVRFLHNINTLQSFMCISNNALREQSVHVGCKAAAFYTHRRPVLENARKRAQGSPYPQRRRAPSLTASSGISESHKTSGRPADAHVHDKFSLRIVHGVSVCHDKATKRSTYKCFSASTSKRLLRSHAGKKQDVEDDEGVGGWAPQG